MNYRDYAKEIKRPNDLYYDPFTQRIVVLDSTVKVQNLYAMIHNEMARYVIGCVRKMVARQIYRGVYS